MVPGGYCILHMKFCNIGIFGNKQCQINWNFYYSKDRTRQERSKLSYLTIERHNTVGSFHSAVAWIECNHVTAVSQSDCSKWWLN